MDPPAWANDDDEDAEETEEKESSWGGRDGIIFLIDATEPMFEEEGEETPFKMCLKCCRTVMFNRIVTADDDLMGIVFFGTNKTENCSNFSHISVLQELETPSADKIKQLEEMLESKTYGNFRKKYGHNKNFTLSEALWHCQSMFSKSQYKFRALKIMLFTNTDHPHRDSATKQHQARQKAMDLSQIGITLDLMHIGKNFDPSVFYQELIDHTRNVDGDDDDEYKLSAPSLSYDDLLAHIQQRDHKTRSVGRIHCFLGPDLKMAVGIYNLVRRAYIPKKVLLDRSTNEAVKVTTEIFHSGTGEILMPSDICKFQYWAGRKIKFTSEEISSVRGMLPSNLTLLGFKPSSSIKMALHLKPGSFIYPDEKLIKGSRKLFAALLDRCLVRNVVPICRFVPRRDSPPRLVALLPQEEVLDESDMQVVPPGFHVVFLPFADDIRNLELSTPHADPEHVEKAKEVIKKLRFRYKPHLFDNPKIQTHWANIEALALDHDDRREIEDHTVPDCENMDEKLGEIAEEFMNMFQCETTNKTGTKRSGGKSSGGQPAKQKKADFQMTPAYMKGIAEEGKVEKMTAKDLKIFLETTGKNCQRWKKDWLVQAVYNHFQL